MTGQTTTRLPHTVGYLWHRVENDSEQFAYLVSISTLAPDSFRRLERFLSDGPMLCAMKWRKSDTAAMVVIWIAVFVGAFVLAALIQDDNPNTDEASGAGALAVVVGGILTVIYLGLRHRRSLTSGLRKEVERTARDEKIDIAGGIGLGVAGIALAVIAGVGGFGAYFCGLLLGGGFAVIRRRRRKQSNTAVDSRE